MTMGATLVWPAVVVLGFLVFTGLVVALGASSTARYEFERNGARQPQKAAAPRSANHPAGRRAPGRPLAPLSHGATLLREGGDPRMKGDDFLPHTAVSVLALAWSAR